MNYFIQKSLQGKLILPLFLALLVVSFLALRPIIKLIDQNWLNARGVSSISIDLQASFIQRPGGAIARQAGLGREAKKDIFLGEGKVFNPKAGALAKDYLGKILQKIEENKTYPLGAQEKKREGIVKLGFVLLKNGSIKKLQILKSAGYTELDQAASEAIKRAQPFPAFSKDIIENSLTIVIEMEFKIE
ncbi:MAG: energy transducer TonB [Candidatus Margulisbacteria bacterium]|nr:energy transducer TonB [Candidatus Margulisiibacteriota bacterium]